jgi:hypothetical protein
VNEEALAHWGLLRQKQTNKKKAKSLRKWEIKIYTKYGVGAEYGNFC